MANASSQRTRSHLSSRGIPEIWRFHSPLLRWAAASILTLAFVGCASNPYFNKAESKLLLDVDKKILEIHNSKEPSLNNVKSELIELDLKLFYYQQLAEKGLLPEYTKGPILKNIYGVKESSTKVAEELKSGTLTRESQSLKTLTSAIEKSNSHFNNIPLKIQWRTPYVHMNGYGINFMTNQNDNGFKINISNTLQKAYWHIQVISDDTIPLRMDKDVKYEFKFAAKSNKGFSLYSRLGEEAVERGNSFLNERIEIKGNNEWHEYQISFIPKEFVKNNLLYLQFGYAEPHTVVEIKDLRFNILTNK